MADQLRLFRSQVGGVIGCGGLGGYLIGQLARLGVGTLVLVDPDVFEEHNLNRQLLSSPAHLGSAKVDVARERVAAINPVTVEPHRTAFSRDNGRELLSGCSAVVDRLDNVLVRRDLAAVCRDLGVPLVHGAIAGWYGQVAVQLPGTDLSRCSGPRARAARGGDEARRPVLHAGSDREPADGRGGEDPARAREAALGQSALRGPPGHGLRRDPPWLTVATPERGGSGST